MLLLVVSILMTIAPAPATSIAPTCTVQPPEDISSWGTCRPTIFVGQSCKFACQPGNSSRSNCLRSRRVLLRD
jgi:hypothetical protein